MNGVRAQQEPELADIDKGFDEIEQSGRPKCVAAICLTSFTEIAEMSGMDSIISLSLLNKTSRLGASAAMADQRGVRRLRYKT